MLRRILSVVAGFLTWSILWLFANQLLVLAAPDHFRDDGTTDHAGILLAILAISVVLSILAGWLTARTSATWPIAHALGLGVLLLLVGLLVQWHYWDMMPLWYHLGFLGLLLPAAVLGGWCQAER